MSYPYIANIQTIGNKVSIRLPLLVPKSGNFVAQEVSYGYQAQDATIQAGGVVSFTAESVSYGYQVADATLSVANPVSLTAEAVSYAYQAEDASTVLGSSFVAEAVSYGYQVADNTLEVVDGVSLVAEAVSYGYTVQDTTLEIGSAAFSHDLYIAQAGDDANDGSTPDTEVLTVARLQPLAQSFGNGVRILFEDELEYREELNLSALDNVTIDGGFSTLNASDIVQGTWQTSADRADAHTNVYSIDWTVSGTLRDGVAMTVDGEMPQHVADLATCQATPNSFHVATADRASNPLTFYVHPAGSTNPNSDGKQYEIMTRDRGLYVGNGATIEKVITQTQVANNGSLEAGLNATLRQVGAFNGHKHNVFANSGLMEQCAIYASEDLNPSYAPVVFYTNDPTGFSWVFRSGLIISPQLGNFLGSGIISHGATVGEGFATGLVEDTVILNWNKPVEGELETSLTIRNSYCATGLVPGGKSPNTRVENVLVKQLNDGKKPVQGSLYYENVYVHSADTNIEIFVLGADTTLLDIRNCTFRAEAQRSLMRDGGMTSGTIRVYNCILDHALTSYGNIIVPAGVTYEGNYNLFFRDRADREIENWYEGARITTLAQWQSLTGQDTNSGFLTTAQRNALYVNDPATGDARINPAAQMTWADGTVSNTFPDGTPITEAGVQQHWNLNTKQLVATPPTRWPEITLDRATMVAFLKDPDNYNFYPAGPQPLDGTAFSDLDGTSFSELDGTSFQ